MIEAAKNNRHGHRDATMILVAYRHGLRAAEVCSLEWSQVDFALAWLSALDPPDMERQLGFPSCPLDQPIEAVRGERAAALRHEHERRLRSFAP
jgi:integrase